MTMQGKNIKLETVDCSRHLIAIVEAMEMLEEKITNLRSKFNNERDPLKIKALEALYLSTTRNLSNQLDLFVSYSIQLENSKHFLYKGEDAYFDGLNWIYEDNFNNLETIGPALIDVVHYFRNSESRKPEENV